MRDMPDAFWALIWAVLGLLFAACAARRALVQHRISHREFAAVRGYEELREGEYVSIGGTAAKLPGALDVVMEGNRVRVERAKVEDETVYVGPLPPPSAGGPPGDQFGGKGEGCHREDQKGESGCDCRCMYGANACPAGDSAPAGLAWCVCVKLSEGGAAGTRHFLCYADCFSANGNNNCTNSAGGGGRSCWCRGATAKAVFGWEDAGDADQWPGPPDGQQYDCTRVIDLTPTGGALASGNYYQIPTDYFPGTPLTYHEVLRTVEEHEGVPDLGWP